MKMYSFNSVKKQNKKRWIKDFLFSPLTIVCCFVVVCLLCSFIDVYSSQIFTCSNKLCSNPWFGVITVGTDFWYTWSQRGPRNTTVTVPAGLEGYASHSLFHLSPDCTCTPLPGIEGSMLSFN